MNKPINMDYYYGQEAEQFSFYRIPRVLLTDERFKGISLDSKVLYGLMLDRMSMSKKNGWLDKNNKVYIFFTIEEAMNCLGYSHSKVCKLFAELDTVKGIGLIERKKQGQGRPTIIYVKNFSSIEDISTDNKSNTKKPLNKGNVKTSQNRKSEKSTNNNSSNDTTSSVEKSNDLSEEFTNFSVYTSENTHISENTQDKQEDVSVDNVDNSLDVLKTEVLTSQIDMSRSMKNGSLDFSKTDANYINNNQINNNQIKSIYPSISLENEVKEQETKKIDGLMDRMSDEELKKLIIDEIKTQKTLPYEYLYDSEKLEMAITILTEYDFHEQHSDDNIIGFDFDLISRNLFNQALLQMLTCRENMKLNNCHVTFAQVYRKLASVINFDFSTPTLFHFCEVVAGDYESACSQYDIKNHLAYMKSIIWNVLQVGNVTLSANMKKNFG